MPCFQLWGRFAAGATDILMQLVRSFMDASSSVLFLYSILWKVYVILRMNCAGLFFGCVLRKAWYNNSRKVVVWIAQSV